jgi:hypothetical protein
MTVEGALLPRSALRQFHLLAKPTGAVSRSNIELRGLSWGYAAR